MEKASATDSARVWALESVSVSVLVWAPERELEPEREPAVVLAPEREQGPAPEQAKGPSRQRPQPFQLRRRQPRRPR